MQDIASAELHHPGTKPLGTGIVDGGNPVQKALGQMQDGAFGQLKTMPRVEFFLNLTNLFVVPKTHQSDFDNQVISVVTLGWHQGIKLGRGIDDLAGCTFFAVVAPYWLAHQQTVGITVPGIALAQLPPAVLTVRGVHLCLQKIVHRQMTPYRQW